MSKRLAWAMAGIVLFVTAPAMATGACPKALQFFSDDTGGILWQKPRNDSPLDPNSSRLMVHVLFQTGDDFAGAFNECTGIEGRKLSQVRNLSFDYQNSTGNPTHTGAGSPAIRVGLDLDGNGSLDDFATLSAFHCNAVLTEDSRWSRADFTGRTAPGCLIFLNSDGTNPASMSDGTDSAWKNLADAHPNGKVVGVAFFILDEVGTAFIDRLAFHNRMFIQAGSGSAAVKNCPSESSC
jgi:hypothetical protein